jgi:hypothetical protein
MSDGPWLTKNRKMNQLLRTSPDKRYVPSVAFRTHRFSRPPRSLKLVTEDHRNQGDFPHEDRTQSLTPAKPSEDRTQSLTPAKPSRSNSRRCRLPKVTSSRRLSAKVVCPRREAPRPGDTNRSSFGPPRSFKLAIEDHRNQGDVPPEDRPQGLTPTKPLDHKV